MIAWAIATSFAIAAPEAPASARPYDGPRAVTAIEPSTRRAPAPVLAPKAAIAATKRARVLGPVRVRWALDAAITVGAGVPYAVLAGVVAVRAESPPLPTSPPDLGRIDRAAFGRYDLAAKTASDALLIASLALGPVATAGLVGASVKGESRPARSFFAQWSGLLLVHAEAIALTGLLTEVMKTAVARRRPFAYYAPDDVDAVERDELAEDQSEPDHARSFPSGHASLAFASAACAATTLTLALVGDRRRRGAIAAVWIVGLALAGTTASLRVVAGRHHPSDVLAGAALGAGIGVAVPLAHASRPREHRLAIVPHAGRGGGGLALRGRLP